MSKIEIKVPSLGESISEATVSKWLRNAGDKIKKDEVILELETDKVTQEIYAAESGKLNKIFFKEGDNVKIGDVLADIETLTSTEKKNAEEIKIGIKDDEIAIVVPSLGESINDAVISSWLKEEGMPIKKGEPIVEIETDKVTQELYAEHDGTIKVILFKEDQEVKIGETIGIITARKIEEKHEYNSKSIDKEDNHRETDLVENNSSSNLDPTNIRTSGLGGKININDLMEFAGETTLTPSARKYLNEKNLHFSDLDTGDSTSNRYTKDDIEKKLSNGGVQVTSVDDKSALQFNNQTDVIKPLSKLRQSIAKNLKNAQNTAAMLTTFNEVDMINVINLRKKYKETFLNKHNVKLGFMSFFTKACIVALKEIPEVNSEIQDNNIVYKNRYDISIAVGTDKGLYVPVLKNADKLTFAGIEKKILEYGKLAKENKITADHMKGGTFTISNGGVYGSMLSTPILNPPQSGILGLHNIVKRPIVINEEIVIRPVMFIALTYDHRIIDGRQAVTFLVRVKEIIENPEELLFSL